MEEKWEDLIIESVSRILIPFIQIYALYVLAHGHSSPGGGFQGGCIYAASLILLFLLYGPKGLEGNFPPKFLFLLSALGVGVLYAGVGAFCMLFEKNFLDYAALSHILPHGPIKARYYGMAMVETGVQFTVMCVMALIFLKLLQEERASV
jgi:multicomponent Na+:H+ antiporter subunit B